MDSSLRWSEMGTYAQRARANRVRRSVPRRGHQFEAVDTRGGARSVTSIPGMFGMLPGKGLAGVDNIGFNGLGEIRADRREKVRHTLEREEATNASLLENGTGRLLSYQYTAVLLSSCDRRFLLHSVIKSHDKVNMAVAYFCEKQSIQRYE